MSDDGDRDCRLDNERLRRELADARRQLEELRAEFDRFAGRLAHDLQAVMQVNEGFAAALSRAAAPKLDERERHYLDRIAATCLRGNRLVHDVLAFARLGVHAIERRPVDLADALRRAQRSVQDRCEARHVAWEVGELPTVAGDASLLQQVFVDLLANALHATRERTTAVIRVECLPTDAGREIRVSDNGAGLDPQAAARLFESFERPHDGAEATGLAHARRIVERHGGGIRAEGAPGGGTLFAFTLPAAVDGGELASAAASDAPHEAAAAPAPAALRVLLVDDDPMVLLSLANMVELDGHHVDSASSGPAGVEIVERALAQGRGYDAVITDLGMPHMDGREVARLVKRASPGTRVILLTGWGSGAGAVDGGAGHVDGILAKPPRLRQLREALSQVRPA